jgi:acetate kinase
VTTGTRRILVVNAGSSSLKLRVLDGTELAFSRDIAAPRGVVAEAPLAEAVRAAGEVDAVGHRIVHGGDRFLNAVVVDDAVVRRLAALTDLAPLHQPKSLAALDAVCRLLPDTPQVACFDTAFHATIPPAVATYALPAEWRRRWPLRKFGFHGLSHAYAARRAAELMGAAREAGDSGSAAGSALAGGGSAGGGLAGGGLAAARRPLRLVTCHLGAGASLAAVLDGRSVDTTMGFTPLDGLVMATRSGSVDPGLVLWLEEHVGMPPAELAATLEHRSGLLGLAGTADLRQILSAERDGDDEAALAVAAYLHRLRALTAAMTASLGGLDGLVFTGGVGENSPEIRRRAADGLGFLGVALDDERNEAVGRTTSSSGVDDTPLPSDDREIGAPGAHVRAFVVVSREDLEIARQVRKILAEA